MPDEDMIKEPVMAAEQNPLEPSDGVTAKPKGRSVALPEGFTVNNGWVKIHRRLLDNPLIGQPSWAWLWVILLLKANHENSEIIWNGSLKAIKAGSFITGRKSLAELSGLSESTVERALNYMSKVGQIEQQKNNKYRVITIRNWSKYQVREQPVTQPVTQPADTNKNVKKGKKNPVPSTGQLGNDVINLFQSINPSYEQLFKRSSQHAAAERLVELHGLHQLERVIGFVASRRGDRFCPSIATPCQLEDKWALLENYANSLKSRSAKEKIWV